MALCNPRLLSEPHRVIFAGFESTTTELQRAGWCLAAEQDFGGGYLRLAMRHEPAGLYMLAEGRRFEFRGSHNTYMHDRFEPLVFVIRHCSSKMMINVNAPSFDFRPIDAEPQMVMSKPRRIEDFGIFAAPMVRTEEIIVEPQSVAECLALIRKMQAPELQAVRERNARRERQEPMNQERFHAQIISLAA